MNESSIPPYVIGHGKTGVFEHAKKTWPEFSGEIITGPMCRAARMGEVFLTWGIPASPLVMRTVESFISLYTRNEDKKDTTRRVFYCCYAGTHTSIVAASLHLGLLDGKNKSTDFSRLPWFDRRRFCDIGVPVNIGADQYGTEVYAVGTGWLCKDLETSLCDLIGLYRPSAKACICSVRGFLDSRARIGGYMSRRLSLVSFGRRLVSKSLASRLPDIGEAVGYCLDLSSRWKDNEKQSNGEVVWIDGASLRGKSKPG